MLDKTTRNQILERLHNKVTEGFSEYIKDYYEEPTPEKFIHIWVTGDIETYRKNSVSDERVWVQKQVSIS